MKNLKNTLAIIGLLFVVSCSKNEMEDEFIGAPVKTETPAPVRQKVSGWFSTTNYPVFSRTHNTVSIETKQLIIKVENDVIVGVVEEVSSDDVLNGLSGVDGDQYCFVRDDYQDNRVEEVKTSNFTTAGGTIEVSSRISGNSQKANMSFTSIPKPNVECIFDGSILSTHPYNGGRSRNDQNKVFWFRTQSFSSTSKSPNHYIVMNADFTVKEIYFANPQAAGFERLDVADYDVLRVSSTVVNLKYNKDPNRINQDHLEAQFVYPSNDLTYEELFGDNVVGELPTGAEFFGLNAGNYEFSSGYITNNTGGSNDLRDGGDLTITNDGATIHYQGQHRDITQTAAIGTEFNSWRITADETTSVRWDPITGAQNAHSYYFKLIKQSGGVRLVIQRGRNILTYNYRLVSEAGTGNNAMTGGTLLEQLTESSFHPDVEVMKSWDLALENVDGVFNVLVYGIVSPRNCFAHNYRNLGVLESSNDFVKLGNAPGVDGNGTQRGATSFNITRKADGTLSMEFRVEPDTVVVDGTSLTSTLIEVDAINKCS